MTGIVAAMMFTISSCDEDTVGIGKTLTSNVDLFTIETDTFDVSSRSIVNDAVLSHSIYTYLGRIKDPETSAYITADYMTQFAVLENVKTVCSILRNMSRDVMTIIRLLLTRVC